MIVPPQTPANRRAALLRGLLSLLTLGGLLLGIPLLLMALTGSPIPSKVPNLGELLQVLNRRDDGTLFIGVVKVITWAAWAAFAVSCLTEIVGLLRGRQTPVLPVLGGAQRLAAYLIATIALGFTTTSANAAMATPIPAPTELGQASPAATSSTPSPKAQETTAKQKIHVVKPGESLWGIAEEKLGDGDRYMEIFKASKHIEQPDGVPALTHPRVIHPNERLVIPQDKLPSNDAPSSSQGEAPAPEEESPRAASPERQEVAGPEKHEASQPGLDNGSDEPSAAPSTPAAPEPTLTPSAAQPNPSAADVVTPTVHAEKSDSVLQTALYSGLTASGLVVLLATKRMIQQRRRRPGHRIRLPKVMSDSEWSARITAAPDDAELLDRALRTLAHELHTAGGALPHIRGVKVEKGKVELTLAEPVPEALPTTPFKPAGGLRWSLEPGALGSPEQLRDTPAPYPAIVTLGQTDDHAPVLIDLELHGAIGLVGEASEAKEVLTAFAIELATSRCADHMTVLCVGFVPELPSALSSSRLRHVATVADALEAAQTHIRDVSESLVDAELSHARHARVTQVAEPAWHPMIVLSALPFERSEFNLLRHLALTHGGLGSAALLSGPDDADPDVLALPTAPGMSIDLPELFPIILQRVAEPTYEQLIDDFTIASNVESIPNPRWHDVPPEPADLLAHMSEEQPAVRPALTLLPSPPAEIEPPAVTEDTSTVDSEATEPTLLETSESAVPPRSSPYIRVLGRIEIEGRDVTNVEPGKRSMAVELAVFLRLSESPSAEQVSRAMGAHRGPWSNSTRASNISRLRGWFGTDDQGRQYVPSQGNRRVYELHDAISCDWHDFQDLATRGLDYIANGNLDDGERDLTEAYALVRGRPFASAGGDRYIWAEHLRQEMISAIVDVAHVLALAHIDASRFSQARTVITKGLDIEPGSELLFRDWFRAEHHAGNRQGLNEAAERLLRNLHDLGLDMEPETAELLDQLLYNPFHGKTVVGSANP